MESFIPVFSKKAGSVHPSPRKSALLFLYPDEFQPLGKAEVHMLCPGMTDYLLVDERAKLDGTTECAVTAVGVFIYEKE